ncbi:hypothetical protein D3C81_1793790 [compost metagenome]
MGKILCPFAYHHNVRAFFQHQTGREDRVTQVADACDGARLQRISVHHAGIQLMGFITGKYGADSGIKQRTLFQ